MKIQAIQTGDVLLKEAFLRPKPGLRHRLDLLLAGPFADPVPLHAWVIEHEGQRILVDTGETTHVKNLPFAQYRVSSEDELPHAVRRVGLSVGDIDTAIVTHTHSDHADGAIYLDIPVLVSDTEWAFANSVAGRVVQRISRAPLPAGVDFKPFALQDGPFGAFAASRKLTDDGRVLAVATPGHTPGHVSVIAIDDDGLHVLLAGDATDSLEQLKSRRPDPVARDPKALLDTIDRIHRHAAEHPTVYIPAHDPMSKSRLDAREVIR